MSQRLPPDSMMEVYAKISDGQPVDEMLQNDVGDGFYSDIEFWEQQNAFRDSMFGNAGIGSVIRARTIEDTKQNMVDAIFSGDYDLECPDIEDLSKEEYYEEHIDDIWNNLGTSELSTSTLRKVMIDRYSSMDSEWEPPHLRMLKFRHEASRSKNARLLDDFFGSRKELMKHDSEIKEPDV